MEPPSASHLQRDQTDQFLIYHHQAVEASGHVRVCLKLAAGSDLKSLKLAEAKHYLPPLSVHRGSIITPSLLSCLLTLKWMVLPVFRRAGSGEGSTSCHL